MFRTHGRHTWLIQQRSHPADQRKAICTYPGLQSAACPGISIEFFSCDSSSHRGPKLRHHSTHHRPTQVNFSTQIENAFIRIYFRKVGVSPSVSSWCLGPTGLTNPWSPLFRENPPRVTIVVLGHCCTRLVCRTRQRLFGNTNGVQIEHAHILWVTWTDLVQLDQ